MPIDREDPPRIQTADRKQIQLRPYDLDSTLPEEHRVRSIWAAVEQLDLRAFYADILARGSHPGRPAIDPKILVALWLFATSEGVGSARQLERLCERDDAYRWLCGGVSVNHHTLSDFRVGNEVALDGLMTHLIAVLVHQKVIKLKRVAHDGLRVRASAGAASFRSGKTLEECAAEAATQVAALKRELETEPSGSTTREQTARERATRERAAAITRALKELPKVQAVKDRNRRSGRNRRRKQRQSEARVSTTDPEARVMKMGDGGWRPGYNVQIASDTESRFIVGVRVTNEASDQGQLKPMLDHLEQRTGAVPAEYLADGGFVKKAAIEEAVARGVCVYTPVAKSRVSGINPHKRKKGDKPAISSWRERMGTEQAKAIYKLRAATAETINADLRCWRGLDRLNIRGLAKVSCAALWAALTYNILRCIAVG
jgi:transposase